MVVKGVFFDFYGTLYLLENMSPLLEEWVGELHARMKLYGLAVTKDLLRNYYHERMWQGTIPIPENGMTIFEKRLEIACSDFNVKMPRSMIEETAEVLITIWDKYAEIDSLVPPLLIQLNSSRIITALISNYDHPKHLHRLVRDAGIYGYFSKVTISGDHGINKPDPAIFQLTLENTGLHSSEVLFVGDSREDVVGANAAGLVSVLIDRKKHGLDYGQKFTITSLNDILGLIGVK
ncbi:MAG: HAD family hydrolase [Dehalococcoidales bacterium]|nr:HAD family hydrolase [Dehalococcoidales bacterium]